ncbi:MAG: PAS domain-containing sensor histidine kinase, partial [Cytophagaceae bacterium]
MSDLYKGLKSKSLLQRISDSSGNNELVKVLSEELEIFGINAFNIYVYKSGQFNQFYGQLPDASKILSKECLILKEYLKLSQTKDLILPLKKDNLFLGAIQFRVSPLAEDNLYTIRDLIYLIGLYWKTEIPVSLINYEELIEFSNELVFTTDEHGFFTYCNPATLNKLGYSAMEMQSKNYLDVIRNDYKDSVKQFYKDQYKLGNRQTYHEFPVINKQGESFWIGQNAYMKIENDRLTGYQIFARDITFRKKAEDDLLKAVHLAEESNKAKENFISVMSHEIRTPMNAVVGMSNLLLDSNPTDEQKVFLQALKISADNLLIMINDILDLSKLSSDKMIFEKIPFNLQELMDRLSKTFEFKAKEKHLKFSINIEKDIPNYLIGDPYRLNQVLLNLLSNAFKFTEEGEIAIECISLKKDKKQCILLFTVRDTGVGISANHLSLIFESFAQAEASTAKNYGGSGLGLTITKKLIEQMGGSISVNSTKHKGSVFFFD